MRARFTKNRPNKDGLIIVFISYFLDQLKTPAPQDKTAANKPAELEMMVPTPNLTSYKEPRVSPNPVVEMAQKKMMAKIISMIPPKMNKKPENFFEPLGFGKSRMVAMIWNTTPMINKVKAAMFAEEALMI